MNNYFRFRDIITSFFTNEDISDILNTPLRSEFSTEDLLDIVSQINKVDAFFDKFDKLITEIKLNKFIDVTLELSDWIADFILTEDSNYIERRFQVVRDLINVSTEFYVDNLYLSAEIIENCYDRRLISKHKKDHLILNLSKEELLLTKYNLMNLIHARSTNCYAEFLMFSYHHNTIFVEIFCEPLFEMLRTISSEEEIKPIIQMYSESIISSQMSDFQSHSTTQQISSNSALASASVAYEADTAKVCHSNNPVSHSNDSSSSSDDYDFDKLFGKVKNQPIRELLNFQPESFQTTDSLRVRQYQRELAEKGIAGHNVLICAPTGSGKTIVAIKIVEEHFKNNLNAKVVFIAPTNELVKQQHKKFVQYLSHLKIIQCSGSQKSGNISLAYIIPDYDIFILTSEILRNSLVNDDGQSRDIGDFTMIVFDECHHCDKSHSYIRIMEIYFKNKLRKRKTPQIIGMTASTGTGKAKSLKEAVEYLFGLCANLDCQIVSTVTSNLSDLLANINIATHEIQTPVKRCFDKFENNLINLMELAEDRVIALTRRSSISIPENKYHDKYLNFISSLRERSLVSPEDVGQELRNLSEYLEVFYRALMVNNLFTNDHALKMIENIGTRASVPAIQGELNNFINESNHSQSPNPSLICLRKEIYDHINRVQSSRIMIFVKEVNYAKILEAQLNNENIDRVKCASFVGTNKPADLGGSTNSALSDTLACFRRGEINVLCCTSVAKEGLDIQECNLVINYGDVTNEIHMMQIRGRARAANAKYVVIIPHGLYWQERKEHLNKFREKEMYSAIEKFQNMDIEDVRIKIRELQVSRLSRMERTLVNNASVVTSNEPWQLFCKICGEFLCRSTDIRLVNKTTHIVINKELFDRLPMEHVAKNRHKITCVQKHEIGNVRNCQGIFLPCIKVDKCLFKCESTGEEKMHSFWKNVQFSVEEASQSEIIHAQNFKYCE